VTGVQTCALPIYPEDKELQRLYRELAFFLRDLGTQYNKFDMNGIFATQYLTKDAFKLPGNINVDFRDACQNQTLLRLPPNQAQVMRLLQRSELQEMRALRTGFGFMGFATGDIIRMAAGYISPDDIKAVSSMVPPAPRVGGLFPGWSAGDTGGRSSGLVVPAGAINRVPQKNTQDLEKGPFMVEMGDGKSSLNGLVQSPPTTSNVPPFVPRDGKDKLVSPDRWDDLVFWYGKLGSVGKALDKMGITNSRYEKHASYILEVRGYKLRKEAN